LFHMVLEHRTMEVAMAVLAAEVMETEAAA
jgi:hypothetical protein